MNLSKIIYLAIWNNKKNVAKILCEVKFEENICELISQCVSGFARVGGRKFANNYYEYSLNGGYI